MTKKTTSKTYTMPINTRLSLSGCWKLVNACQNGKTPGDIRERCRIAEEWLNKNEIITNEEYDSLMMSVSLIHRETYHM